MNLNPLSIDLLSHSLPRKNKKYIWGDGSIFEKTELSRVLPLIADLGLRLSYIF
jgi:hypothetical protein